MNKLFYRDLREIVLMAIAREEIKRDLSRRLAEVTEKCARDILDRPHITQPTSDNNVCGPTS